MRYLPLTNDDRKNMKKVIGISDSNEMFTNVPKEVSLDPKFNLPNHKTEMEVGKILSEIANHYWGKDAFYHILLLQDMQFQEAYNNLPSAKQLID